MTKEEIKQTFNMRDILAKCGLPEPNRAGFIKCPFHKGDHDASLKIYDKDFHCFGCGANGDIFSFIQKFYGISFKDAFLMLGGEYEKKMSFKTSLSIYHANKEREMRDKNEVKLKEEHKLNNDLISLYRRFLSKSKPLSEAWCDCYNALQLELYHAEILEDRK
ncbi:CHC2 zinc finger domain-containing protein [Coprococcus comes]|jgi:DNA primase|uniref:CHC2 zinc finger domain-containing protein n=1 Tax=Coprococcus comes TaxID=410072 RepID=UPI001570F2B3|nr:CHC2 zinc finger domain-containing protein [Coprococcus comes]NSG34258.1 DNA primase [Coprococcus comes]